MKEGRSALIIGGSIGGLFAANVLAKRGWIVDIYEHQSVGLESRGAGIATHQELADALQLAGVNISDGFGVRVLKRVTLNRAGQRIGQMDLPQVFTAWGQVFKLLRAQLDGARYHNGKQLVHFEQSKTGVTAEFRDGTSAHADLMIGADGLRSFVRAALQPDSKPQYAGYVAWRGMVDESKLSASVLQDVFPFLAFDLPDHEQMASYPVAGRDNQVAVGHRRCNFVWYRPAGAPQLQEMVTDETGKVWPEGIPPPLIRREVLEQVRKEATAVLSPQMAEVVQKTDQLFFQPIFDLESHHIAFGRVALLGDAAFVARPHCGMGVTKAGGDAIALADALDQAGSIEEALAQYQMERLAYGTGIVGHSRNLGAYMQSVLATVEERQMADAYRSPEAVMRETALPPTDFHLRPTH